MGTLKSSPLAPAYPVNDAPPLKVVGFLIIPNFTTIGFASAVETLRMANLAARKTMFQTLIIAADMEPVSASNGMRILPDFSIKDAPKLDMLFVVGPNPIVSDHNTRPILNLSLIHI